MIGIVITFPLFIYGNIFNLTFLEIPNLQIRKIKDPQFHSSIRYGISLALAFVFLPVYLILSLFIFSSWWLGLLIFLTLPLSGLFAWNYYLQFRRIIGGFRIRSLISKKTKNLIFSETIILNWLNLLPHYRMKNDNLFKGKVAWITGASSGIGESLVHEFVRRWCNCYSFIK